MLQIFYEVTDNVFAEMQTVRYQTPQVGTRTAVGETSVGKIQFDDPGGTLDIKGWRMFRVFETTASPTLLASGRIRNKTVKRGDGDRPSLRTGADRWWDCDAVDQNTLLGARIIHGTDANRPAETAGERLRWLLDNWVAAGHTSSPLFDDLGHVTYPSDRLDPNDYTGQTAMDVLSDCAQPGGYNFFVMETAPDDRELFFMLPTSSDWASTISISDDPADYDGETVFLPNYGAELQVSDEIIAFGVFLPYNGSAPNSYVYVQEDDTGSEFARVDRAVPMANVKTSAKATVIANRHLAISSTEDEHITCTIHVPADKVNALRPWHRVSYKSTWMPNFTTYRDCRVVNWSIEQQPFSDGGEGYLIHLELSPVSDASVGASCSTALGAMESDQEVGKSVNATEPYPVGSPSVAITPSYNARVIAFIAASNPNTPGSTNMNTPSGFTSHINVPTLGRGTFDISSKSVSSGATATAATTFTDGFNHFDLWHAFAFAIQTSATSPVQDVYEGVASDPTLPSAPTPGNLFVMCAFQTDLPGGSADVATPPGWTQVAQVVEPFGNWVSAVWVKCVEEGDDAQQSWDPYPGLGLGTYLAEWAIT